MLDFFICGAQKCGTTALTEFLSESPGIGLPNKKELHFFDYDRMNWLSISDYSALHAQFPGQSFSAAKYGEATPIYMYWPNAMERLKKYNPAARIIILLRHPAYRAYSQWKMETGRGLEHLPFSLAVSEIGRARVTRSPGGVHRVYSYVERGFYGDQMERIYSLFPRSQVLVLRTDDLWRNLSRSLEAVFAFLEIRDGVVAARRYVSPVQNNLNAQIHKHDLSMLTSLYCDQIEKAQSITGIDLSDWLSDKYVEPMD